MTTIFLALTALASTVLEDGVIDAGEIESLRINIYNDGEVDTEELDILFDLNDNCESYDDAWPEFVAQAVYDYAAADGEVDETEAAYIRSKIEADGEVDAVEIAILNKLLTSGATLPPSFALWARTQVATAS